MESQSYGALPAIWHHTVLPATRHRWACPALTPAMQAGTRSRRDGRLSLPCYSETPPPGVELATSRSWIQRPNHWATKHHGAVIMALPLPEFIQFIYVCNTSAGWPPTFGPSQSAWASDPPELAAVALHSPSPFIITQLESWYSFYCPT